MSLFFRLISRADNDEDAAAPLRLTPKDRGLGSGIGAGSAIANGGAGAGVAPPISRQNDEDSADAQPARAMYKAIQRPTPLRRVEDEAPSAQLARMEDDEADAPAAKRVTGMQDPEATPHRMVEEDAPAPHRIEAEQEEAQPQREMRASAHAAASLQRVDTSANLPAEQPADELRNDGEGKNLAAKRHMAPSPLPAAGVHSPSLATPPSVALGDNASFAPATAPPPSEMPTQTPVSDAPAQRPKVQIDQIDVIVGSQGSGQNTTTAPASGARALLARRYVRGY